MALSGAGECAPLGCGVAKWRKSPLVSATRAIHAVEHQQGLRVIPIVALTAHAFREQQAKCLEVGMNRYLSKPITLATLTSVLQQYQRPLASSVQR